jgi:uncharacterized protein YjbJ (UPF0337 family)
MEKFSKNVQIKTDKLAGKTKEVIGKVTNNKELEVKGKIQSTKADIDQKVTDIKNDASKNIKDFKNNR